MQRIFNVNKWTTLPEGSAIEYPSTKPRVVRLEVNAPSPVSLFVVSDGEDPEASFLARVEGRDTVEFHVTGKFSLTCEGGFCNVYTIDGDRWAFVDLAPIVFTRIAERRRRNPELERMMLIAQHNMERRLEQQAEEFRRMLDRRDAARAALAAPPAAAGATSESGDGSPDPDDGGAQEPRETGKRGRKVSADS